MYIKKTCSPKARRGFSLLELLMVLTLAPVVFFALYSSFSAGVRVWTAVVRPTPEEDLNIFYTKARRDLENMLRTESIPLTGESREISFPCAIEAPPELGGSYGIGQVRIFYDPSSKTVSREVKNFSQVHRGAEGQKTILLKGVSEFSLFYLSAEVGENQYNWSDSWTPKPGALPVALRLSFATKEFPDKQERVIYIPVGGILK